jgi:hypothetical protein
MGLNKSRVRVLTLRLLFPTLQWVIHPPGAPPDRELSSNFAQFAASQGDSVLYGTALHKNSARKSLYVLLVSLKPLGALL